MNFNQISLCRLQRYHHSADFVRFNNVVKPYKIDRFLCYQLSQCESDDEHCSFESKLKLVDFDIHDEMKDKFFKFTDSYDAWMNRHEYEDQKLSDRHPFTVQQFSEEFSAIFVKQIVQKGTDSA